MARWSVVCGLIVVSSAFGAETRMVPSIDGGPTAARPTIAEIERLNGEVYDLLRAQRWSEANRAAQSALRAAESALGPDHPATATALHNFASSWRELGRLADALPLLRRSLAVAEKIHGVNHPDIAVPAAALGLILLDLGQPHEAVQLLQRALALIEKAEGSSSDNRARAANNLSAALIASGRLQDALAMQQQALTQRERQLGPRHPGTATMVANLAYLQLRVGQPAAALANANKALEIREALLGPEHADVALSLDMVARVLAAQDRFAEALTLRQRALAIQIHAENRLTQLPTLAGLRDDHAALGHRDAAIFFGKRAVNLLQQVRGSLSAVERRSQESFAGHHSEHFAALATLLVDAGRLTEAEQVLAMLKQHELFELLRQSDPERRSMSYTGQERLHAQALDELERDGLAEARELALLEQCLRSGVTLTPTEEARRTRLLLAAQQWQARFRQWQATLVTGMAEGPTGQALAQRQITEQTSAMGRAVRSDPRAVGLQYIVGSNRLSIIVTTSRASIGRHVNVTREALSRQVHALRRAILDRDADPRPAALALYASLIAPIAEDLRQAQAQQLLLSLTDTLRYVPFAALHDGHQWLIEKFSMANLSADITSRARPPAAPWQAIGMGVTTSHGDFAALPAVRRELRGVVRTAESPDGALPGLIHLDAAFDRRSLELAVARSTPVVHIASHFQFSPGDQGNTFLLLGDGTHMTLQELAALDFQGIDLLTLSACDTAMGGGLDETGAEIEGLATAVQRQGAESVLATLWPVADDSTALLMQRFYRRQSTSATGKAEALRWAQLSLLNQDDAPANGPVRSRRRYGHPFFWAPFVLSGNWK